jgi:hypothetical protein
MVNPLFQGHQCLSQRPASQGFVVEPGEEIPRRYVVVKDVFKTCSMGSWKVKLE